MTKKEAVPTAVSKEAATPTMAELLEERLKMGASMGRAITVLGWDYEKYVKVQSAINSLAYEEYAKRYGTERGYSQPTWCRQTWIVEVLRSAIVFELSKYAQGSMKETLQSMAAEGVLMVDGIEEGIRVTNASLEAGQGGKKR